MRSAGKARARGKKQPEGLRGPRDEESVLMSALEEGLELSLDFEKLRSIGRDDLQVIPVALQDADSNELLFVGFANERAVSETLATRQAVLWSTSRNELWRKGEGSGDVLDLVEVRVNCEQNSLLYRVRPRGAGSCHTRSRSGKSRRCCYYRRLNPDGSPKMELEFDETLA